MELGAVEARGLLLALVLAGISLAGAEAAFFHGRSRFLHPAMWVPAAYALLALALGIPHLVRPAHPLALVGFYYLLWVGVAVGLAGHLFHVRRGVRLLGSPRAGHYRALTMGPPLLYPLITALLALLGLAAFHLV